MFPQLERFTDLSLLLLRLIIGLVFVTSGYSDLKAPTARAKSIETPVPFTTFLGIAEIAGGLGVAFGVPHSTRSLWSHPHHVWRHREKDIFLAHRLLG
jgi:uncharacterized membrane protein YphA (DoxX/SURF4 family)